MDLSEILIHSTVQIKSTRHTSAISGTGFLFAFSTNEEDKIIPVIITNRHIVEDATRGQLVFSLKDNDGNYVHEKTHSFLYDDFSRAWFFHPDPLVDLCVMPIHQLYKEYRPNPYSLYVSYVTEKDIPSSEEIKQFSHIENTIVVGYPSGIIDDTHNLPLVRSGITASSLHYDFKGQPEFLIDAAIYGGSSGSPVFVYNNGCFNTKRGTIFGQRTKLVGVNKATYQHQISNQIAVPNGLGVAIHARKILDFKPILLSKLEP